MWTGWRAPAADCLVTPNTNPAVITRGGGKKDGGDAGFYTPSEAFAAIAAGARTLKLFPAATGRHCALESPAGGVAKRCAGLCRGRAWAPAI